MCVCGLLYVLMSLQLQGARDEATRGTRITYCVPHNAGLRININYNAHLTPIVPPLMGYVTIEIRIWPQLEAL